MSTKEYYKNYRQEHREKRNKYAHEYNKKYSLSHKDESRAYKKEYYNLHREEIKTKSRDRYNTNKDKYRQRAIERYKNNKNRILALNTKRRTRNMVWLCEHLGVDKLFCQRCGYSEYSGSIEGHHTDTSQKEYRTDSLSYWMGFSINRFMRKILGTSLAFLCRNCHQSFHHGIWKIEEIQKGGNEHD